MSSTNDFVNYIIGYLNSSFSSVRYRGMFGEYCVYINNKVIGFICDNRFFVKITKSGVKFLSDNKIELPTDYPYRGAKLYFVVDEIIENSEVVSEFITQSLNEIK